MVAAALVLGVASAVASRQIPVGAAVALVVATVVFLVADRTVRVRALTSRRQLRAALSMVDAELSAGAREQDALVAAALVGGELAAVFRAAGEVSGRGGDVAAILREAGPGCAGLAAAWAMRSTCGTPLAEIVAKVEVDVAAAQAHDRVLDAALAGPRSSAAMLSVLPVVGVALGSAMGAHPLRLLLTTPHGSLLLLVGVAIDILGLLWTRFMVRTGSGR